MADGACPNPPREGVLGGKHAAPAALADPHPPTPTMTTRRTLSAALVALACALPSAASAQETFGPSLEVSAGPSLGGGGSFVERVGAGFDAVLALPLGDVPAGTVVFGFTGAMNGSLTSELVCLTVPGAECMTEYPSFFSLGAFGGVQRELSPSVSARVLAGGAYFQAVDGEDAFGLQGRVDVAKSLGFHTAVVASLRTALLPSYEEATLGIASFGIGLRIQ